ncbi:hypothetical protein C8R46DRAFT_277138 [Mycena filopes]|nr:hypothetical protein C8R46DRAFT_277138 [Mycena filopes]
MLTLDHDRARITELDAQIRELRAARDVVQARLDAFKYPVLTVPNEVICEIFTQFVPLYPLCPPLVGPGSPIVLTHICHLWREIAVSLPALWRAIDLSKDIPSGSGEASICGVWLKRSLSTPLSMRIGNTDAGLETSGALPTAILHRARWEYLEIRLVPSELIAIVGPMPSLRHLDLGVTAGVDDGDAVTLLDVPLLRSVTLNGYATRHVNLPWAQITSLTLNYVYPDECQLLLEETSNLVHCRLDLMGSVDSDLVTLHEVSLPHLETLVMTGGSVVEYLDAFIVPALLTLEIPESSLGPDPVEYLRSFILASDCKLRDVVITHEDTSSSYSYRSALPSIDKFSFRCY